MARRSRLAALLTAALTLAGLFGVPATAATVTATVGSTITFTQDTPYHGGTGGSASTLDCAAGTALSGLTLVIDSRNGYGAGLELACVPVDGTGSVAGSPTAGPSVSGLYATPSSERVVSSCPSGTLVTGDSGRAGALIDDVRVLCSSLQGGTFGAADPGGDAHSATDTSGGSAFGPDSCPAGQLAMGVDARVGDDLDGFALRCGTLFAITSLSVTPSPATTGPGASNVPISSISLAGLPSDAVDAVASAPLRSVPLRSVPLRSVPLRSVPLRSVPLTSIPLRSVLLSQVPLTGTSWQTLLAGTPLATAPLETVTLDQALDALRAAGRDGPTVDQVDLSGTPLHDVSMASVFLGGSGLGQLPLPAPPSGYAPDAASGNWCGWLASLGYSCTTLGLTGSSPVLAADLAGVPLRSVPLRSVPLRSVPVDAPLRSVPLRSVDVAGSPLRSVPLRSVTLVDGFGTPTPFGAIPLSSLPRTSAVWQIPIDSATSSLVTCITCATLGEAKDSGAVVATATLASLAGVLNASDLTLGDLGAVGDATIGDLARWVDATYALTLGDVLLALMPPSAVPWEQVPLDPLQLQQYGGESTPTVSYTIAWSTVATVSGAVTGTLDLTLPPGFRFAGPPNLYVLDGPPPDRVDVTGRHVTVTLAGRSPGPGSFTVTASPALALGPYPLPVVTAHLQQGSSTADATSAASESAVKVTDTAEPANNDPPSAPVIAPDHLVLGHISAPGDVDYYRLPVPPDGTHVHVLLSHLATDEDLVVYGPPDAAASPSAAPLRSVPLRSVPLLDDGISTSGTSVTPQLLNDVPLLPALPLRGESAHHGTDDEEVGTLSNGLGKYLTIQVSGYNGASSNQPYLLRVVEDTPATTACPSLGHASQLVGGSLPAGTGDVHSLLLVNPQQLEAEYPGTSTALLQKLQTFAARADVAGLVVPVDADPATVAAYNAWNANPCDVAASNGVVASVSAIVRAYRTGTAPNVTSVTLIGSDSQLPMLRTPDLTLSSNESGYAESDAPASGDNPLTAAQKHSDLLSDDAYGSLAPVGWLDRRLYLPDLAVGRLVETPDQIGAQLDQFVSAGGALATSSALTTGYDFLADGAHSVDTALAAAVGAGTHQALIDDPGSTAPPWTRSSLLGALFPSTGSPSLDSVNAHFDHNRALPSAGNTSGDQSNLFTVSDVAGHPNALTGRVLFSMGCHAGLNVPDRYVGGGANAPDWAQTFATQRAVWVANTGFGLGDTASVALSEELMRLLAQRLNGSMTAGQALQYAKQAYFGSLGAYGVYDEKAMEEAVFYGLPMWRVGGARWDPTSGSPVPGPVVTPSPQGDPVAAGASKAPATEGTLAATDVTVHPTFTASTTSGRGTFWTVGGETQVTHYRPVQPRTSVGVTPPTGQVAHGALLTGLTSEDHGNVNPVISRPTIDLAANEPEPQSPDTAFPSQFQTLTSFATPAGPATRLVLLPGQFFSTPGQATGTQRLFTTLTSRVLYGSSTTPFDPPQLSNATDAHPSGSVSFSVDIAPRNGASVLRALVLYRVGSSPTWQVAPLSQSSSPSSWTATVPVGSGNVEWIAEAADSFGNTAVTDDKGELYGAEAGFTAVVEGTAGDNGWYTGTPTVSVAGPAASYAITVDGVPVGGPPAVIPDGNHHVVVLGSDGSTHDLGQVRVDTQPPTARFTSPVGGVFLVNGPGDYTATCDDGTIGSGVVASSCPTAGVVDTSTAGSRSLAPQLRDVAGNTAVAALPFTVQWSFAGFFSPVTMSGLNAAKAGATVPVKFSLRDARGDVGDLRYVTGILVTSVTCPSATSTSTVSSTNDTSSLKYDPVAHQYVYNWKTSAALKGTCQRLTVSLNDTTVHSALFQFS